ncbi:hypothetical protein RKE25_21900 [Dyella sp. BiH032]|uniref:hypothetical protein n=1 Tax=Dyella sp. BiH032 TaxID=3075430 RepID=UPI0028937821|nr:hypothetical protein [Dyella sp. BiH032]WNL46031.1 hypothetical protein RKE25_21900 [Dyella sp. BiH032]
MSSIRWMLALILLFPLMGWAQSASPQYFGYFYNDASSYNSSATSFSENYNRINLYHIDMWAGNTTAAGRDGTTTYVLSQLEQARINGVKAIITATPFVFQYNASGQWQAEPNASAVWSAFVDRLISAGYLIPGNPQLSTVAAIYLIDEPELSGLYDQDGAAHPAMINAINAIRGNPATASVPLAMILTPGFVNMPNTVTLTDWVGFDDYGASDARWDQEYDQLKSMLAPNQRTILVPKASSGCDVGGGSSYPNPFKFYDLMLDDPTAIWLSPFRWFSPDVNCPGVRDIPSLTTPYNQIGQTFKQWSNPVIGNLDGIAYSGGDPILSGWSCTKGVPQSIYVDVYVGAPYGAGGIYVGRYLANAASEPAVASSCAVSGGNYRFAIPLTTQIRTQYFGKKIYVYGIATYNGNNNAVGNSGNIVVP